MAAAFPGQVSAVQVGTFFVGQYYHLLQQQPDMMYQFYNDASSVMRIDGDATETANSVVQIHSVIMALDFTGIEIKTAHFLNSWDGGVLVVVSGFVQTRGYNARRRFVQTFFLAPQEKGYFILNDVFQFFEEEHSLQHPAAMLAQNNIESNLTPANSVPEAVPDYMLEREIQSREFVSEVPAEQADMVDMYTITESHHHDSHHHDSQPDDIVDETPAEEPVASFPYTTNIVHEPTPLVEDHVEEQPKHTYASILRSAKAQSSSYVPQSAPLRNPSPVSSEWQQPPQTTQQAYASMTRGADKSSQEAVEEVATFEDDGEPKSVYVGNLHPSISEGDLEHEFKNFGRIRPDGVAIRSRKDTGSYYAFVEFEDLSGVQNALRASPIILNGREIYVEERRPNSGVGRGGRGRGRGSGGYSDAPRGRLGSRSYGRTSAQDNNDRDYNSRPRGNGFYRRGGPRQGGNQVTRNTYPSEATA